MFKVVFFAIEQLAEPISNQIERVASQSPSFRRGCIRVAQRLHRENVRRWALLGRDEAQQLKTLDAEKAVTMGCEVLGEGIVWSVGLGVLAYQMREDDLAEEEQNAKLEDMQQKLNAMVARVEVLEVLEAAAKEARVEAAAKEARVEAVLRLDAVDTAVDETNKPNNNWGWGGLSFFFSQK